MASDSNITGVKGNKFIIKSEQVAKTDYFKEYKLGISIWGKFEIEKEKIWEYINEALVDFFNKSNEKENLPTYLEEKLNNSLPSEAIFKFDEKKRFIYKLGIHLSTYLNINGSIEPVLYHITNDRKTWKFIAQADIYPTNNQPPYMVFNGVNKPFYSARDHFIKYLNTTSQLFQKIIKMQPDIQKTIITEEYRLEKELKLLITTIKHYQSILEFNGLKPIIGGRIEGICFNEIGLVKRLSLEDI